MVRNEFTFPSADGRTGIHAVEWMPDMAPRAVLVLSHGVSEHILRYEPLAAYLTEWGFAVAGHDHLGHGLSVAAGAPRLYFGPRGSWDWAVQGRLSRVNAQKSKNIFYEARMRAISSRKSCSEHR